MLSRCCKHFLFLLLCLFVLLIARDSVRACSCGARPTVLDSYDSSDVVIIARLLSVEKVKDADDRHYVDGVRSATMVVERVFKGNLKVRDEVVFGQGGGADCVWTFNEKWIGEQFLFYVRTPRKDSANDFPGFREPDWWYAGTCGRSTGLEYATEDLLYLENVRKVRGKTRLSGTIGGGWRNPDINVENKLIKIGGPKKTYQVKTDAHGVFEIYDLPPGKYLIEPETPSGYKIDKFMLSYSPSVSRFDDDEAESNSPGQVPVVLEPKKHASVNIDFVIDNAVRGTVMDPNGKPMYGVCVYLWRPDQNEGFGPFDCTDEKGQFEITEASAGQYIVVANNDGKLSAREPFKTLFYPNVLERERAALITIGPGQVVNDVNIVVTKLEEAIVIEGTLKYSDGKPVADKWVKFKANISDDKKNKIDGDVTEKTDSAGRFSLKVLKGLTGELSAEEWLTEGVYINCPKIDELLAKSGRANIQVAEQGSSRSYKTLTVTSNVLTIQSDQNHYRLELTFPFPRCEKSKE